jgi:hypothetical protein
VVCKWAVRGVGTRGGTQEARMESSGTRPSEGEPPVPERAGARRRAVVPNRAAQERALL